MEKDLDFKYANNDFDITKYILIAVKKYKIIFSLGIVFFILNFVYSSYKDVIVKSSLIVDEKQTIQFSLMPTTYDTLEKMGFSTKVFFELHKGNFFNYNNYLLSFKKLDPEIIGKTDPRTIFDSLEFDAVNLDPQSGEYSLSSTLGLEKNAYILSRLIQSAEIITFNNLLSHLSQKRLDTVGKIDELKNRLIYEINLKHKYEMLELENKIKDLKINLAVATSMGYIEPVLNIFNENDTVIQINEDELGEFSETLKKQLMNESNTIFLGSRIISAQIEQVKKQLKEMDTVAIEQSPNIPDLLIRSANFDTISNIYLENKATQQQLTKVISEIEDLKTLKVKTAFLVDYNINRVVNNNVGTSLIISSIFAFLIGIAISFIYVIIKYNVQARIRDDKSFALDKLIN